MYTYDNAGNVLDAFGGPATFAVSVYSPFGNATHYVHAKMRTKAELGECIARLQGNGIPATDIRVDVRPIRDY